MTPQPMKKILPTLLALASLAPCAFGVTYDDVITAIYGDGNPDADWTSSTGTNGIKLALRAKNRTTGEVPNVNDVYSFAPGVDGGGVRALWNFEFSIFSGSDTTPLNEYDYFLGIDLDPSQGISYLLGGINALTTYPDNAYGDSTTANGAGIVGTSALGDTNSLAQNSQNITFGYIGLDPNLDATYNYELFAVSKGTGVTGTRLAEVGITVVVGKGGASVPDGGTTAALLGASLLGLLALSRRRPARS